MNSRCATRALNLSGSQTIFSPLSPGSPLSGPVTSGEGRLQVHFAQWGESVGGTKSHPTRAREGVTRKQHLLNRDGSIPSANVGGAHGAVSSDMRLFCSGPW